MREASRPVIMALVLLVGAAVAGCLGMEEDDPDANRDAGGADAIEAQSAPDDGEPGMTANESVDESEGLHEGLVPPFQATRIVTVEGEIRLDRLPADLEATSGDILVRPSGDDDWRLVATMTGYGSTPMEARENRDTLTFTWSIGTEGAYHLVAEVEAEDDEQGDDIVNLGNQRSSKLLLEVPDDVLDELVLGSVSGDIDVRGLNLGTLRIDVTSGDIEVDVEGTRNVALTTTSGDIAAVIDPARSGSIGAHSTSGDVDVRVPEDDDHGYTAVLSTTSGDVEVELKDGDAQVDERPGGASGSFRTDGLRERPIRTDVTMSTTSGDVTLGPR